jgi:hypothetical protein
VAWVRAGQELPSLVRLAFLVYYVNMKRSIPVVRKKRGRPATGQDPVTAIRLSAGLKTDIDGWVSAQADKPDRSEAIRRLVQKGLDSDKKRRFIKGPREFRDVRSDQPKKKG